MPENAPWAGFRVGSLSDVPNWVAPACQPLTEVYHVAHLEPAYRIIVDGKIRAGLVYDESILNQERILVSWLSPNYWYPGFRYGSVRFTFDWPSLIAGHNAYWVESIPYGVDACRILLTRNDFSNHGRLTPYDPTRRDGPWWLDESTGTHYWNGNHCLEFMVEHDIELTSLRNLDFVDHHASYCSIDYRTCPELGLGAGAASARFLSRLAAAGIGLPDALRSDPARVNRLGVIFRRAMIEIEEQITDAAPAFNRILSAESPGSAAIGRALLNAYANPILHSEIPVHASFFRSHEDVLACCSGLINSLIEAPPSS